MIMLCISSLNVLGQTTYINFQSSGSSVETSGTVSELDNASAFTIEAMVLPTALTNWSWIFSKELPHLKKRHGI